MKKYWLLVPIGIIILLYFINPLQIYKQISFPIFYSQLMQATKSNDCSTIYNLLSDNFKSENPMDTYISKCQDGVKATSLDYTIYSYKVEGNIGYVDRRLVECFNSDCTGNNRSEDRLIKKYLFVNWHWEIPDEQNSIYCSRTLPYSNPEEFNRAISLIIQRIGSSNADRLRFSNQIQSIKNCLDIKYANSEDELSGAEGEFLFSPSSTSNDLQILVSPKYQATDDLLTAILLSHEVSHAMFFSTGAANSFSCYENEAHAYYNEFAFYAFLNPEEQQSLKSRLFVTNNVTSTLSQFLTIINQPGNDGNFYQKALTYVQNSPYYIKECSK